MWHRRCEELIHNMAASQQAFALLDVASQSIIYANPVMTAFIKQGQVLGVENLFSASAEAGQALARCAHTQQLQAVEQPALHARLEMLPLMDEGAVVAVQCWALPHATSPQALQQDLDMSFEAILQNFPCNVFLCHVNGDIFWTNKTSNQFKFGKDDISDEPNTSWINPMHPEDFDYACQEFSTGMAIGQMQSFRFRMRHHTGRYHWFQCLASPMLDAQGRIKYWVACNTDVDKFNQPAHASDAKIKSLEQQLQLLNSRLQRSQQLISHSQKLELVTNLAGGVAHDLNNLLFVMGLNTDLVQRKLQDPVLKDNLKAVRDAVRKASRLSSQLAGFSGRKPESAAAVNPQKFVGEISDFLRNAVGAEVDFSIHVDAASHNILVDKTYLENALINLAINARDAVEGRGTVRLHVGNTQVQQDGSMQEFLAFSMQDNGSGMTEEVQARVFEPFFTTKAPGDGTGLGLPMVKNFVDNSNGLVQVRSSIGVGSTITMLFPPTTQAAVDVTEPEAALEGGSEVVLIVEDDRAVREAVANTLYGLGYKIVSAASPEHAILLLQGGLQIDLVISDIKMPGKLTIMDMIGHIEAHHTGTPIIFATGYSANIAIREGLVEGQYPVLFKPFSIDELAHTVRTVLPRQN